MREYFSPGMALAEASRNRNEEKILKSLSLKSNLKFLCFIGGNVTYFGGSLMERKLLNLREDFGGETENQSLMNMVVDGALWR